MAIANRTEQIKSFITNQLSVTHPNNFFLFVVSGTKKKGRVIVVNEYVSDIFRGFAFIRDWNPYWTVPSSLKGKGPLIRVGVGPLKGSVETKTRRICSLILAVRDLSPSICVEQSPQGEMIVTIADFAKAMAEFEIRTEQAERMSDFGLQREERVLSRIVDGEDGAPLVGTIAPPATPRQSR